MAVTQRVEKKAVGRFRYYKWSVFKNGKKVRSGYNLRHHKAESNAVYQKYLKERKP